MRTLLLLPLAGLLLAFVPQEKFFSLKSWDMHESWSAGQPWKDASIPAGQTGLTFTFSAEKTGLNDTVLSSIQLGYNNDQRTIRLSAGGKYNLLLKPGKYVFRFFFNSNHAEVTTDTIQLRPGFRTPIAVDFPSTYFPVYTYKPVIYVYPPQTQAVSIQLTNNGPLDFTYPAYNNGWNFTADPDGTLHMNGRTYSYLYWDAQTAISKSAADWSAGFVVEKDSLVPFFETKLSAMGLSPREMEDYITYWVPRMNANEKNYIHFSCNEEYAQFASLKITPQPDQLFRVYMTWSKADETVTVHPQTLPSFQRNGFTVVEWGGTEMPQQPVNAL